MTSLRRHDKISWVSSVLKLQVVTFSESKETAGKGKDENGREKGGGGGGGTCESQEGRREGW